MMTVLHINMTEVVAILIAGALLMVPVIGLTIRFTVPPIIDALGRSRPGKAAAAAPSPRPAAGGADGAARTARPRPGSAVDGAPRELIAVDL
jgi:hypothetical protein